MARKKPLHEHDISKLPKWARDRITHAEHRIASLERDLEDAYSEKASRPTMHDLPPITISGIGLSRKDGAPLLKHLHLPRDATIHFWLDEEVDGSNSSEIAITHSRDRVDAVEIRATGLGLSRALIVEPMCVNTVLATAVDVRSIMPYRDLRE